MRRTPKRCQRSHIVTSLLLVGLCVSMAGCIPTVSSRTKAGTPTPTKTALLTPVPKKTAPAPIDEYGPAGRRGWFLWERANYRKGTENYWAQKNGGPWIRINPKGTFGRAGDVARGRVVYAQERIHRYRSTQTDIWQYNLRTGHRSRLPRPVNTWASEKAPSLSGHHILFQRQFRPDPYATATDKVMLFDRNRHVMKTLAVVHQKPRDDYAPTVGAGQLNGSYATWSRLVWTEEKLAGGGYYDAPQSLVALYNVKTGTTTKYRLQPSTLVSTAAVSSSGTLYYVRYAVTASTDETSTQAYFMRLPLGGTPEVIAKMPRRLDVGQLYVDDQPNGSHLLYFTVADSDGMLGESDIYKINDPPPPPSN